MKQSWVIFKVWWCVGRCLYNIYNINVNGILPRLSLRAGVSDLHKHKQRSADKAPTSCDGLLDTFTDSTKFWQKFQGEVRLTLFDKFSNHEHSVDLQQRNAKCNEMLERESRPSRNTNLSHHTFTGFCFSQWVFVLFLCFERDLWLKPH